MWSGASWKSHTLNCRFLIVAFTFSCAFVAKASPPPPSPSSAVVVSIALRNPFSPRPYFFLAKDKMSAPSQTHAAETPRLEQVVGRVFRPYAAFGTTYYAAFGTNYYGAPTNKRERCVTREDMAEFTPQWLRTLFGHEVNVRRRFPGDERASGERLRKRERRRGERALRKQKQKQKWKTKKNVTANNRRVFTY
jgi:hypothetical protein